MLTLTYLCPPTNGRKAKADLKAVLQWLKRRSGKKIEYVWFAEFTRRGNIHFHIITTHKPTKGDRVALAEYWVKRTKQGSGPYCSLRYKSEYTVEESIRAVISHEKTWELIREDRGAKRYIAKYACKPHQRVIPGWFSDMGRWWGMSERVKNEREQPVIVPLDEDHLRAVLESKGKAVAGWDVLPRYLWGIGEEDLSGLL